MTLPIIPFWIVSLLALVSGLLSLDALWRYKKMPFQFKVGLAFIAPALIGFAVLYWYFAVSPVEQEVRENAVRIGLSYLFFMILIWQIVLHRWGVT